MKKKKVRGLTLKEYREKYRTPVTVIAYRCGLTFHQVYNILRGGCPTLLTAIIIEQYTDGEVTCESLLPPEMMQEIEKRKEEHESDKSDK
jgi:hypothetical protein